MIALCGERFVWKSAFNQTISTIAFGNKIDDCKINGKFIIIFVESNKNSFVAVCIFFIPLFECLCCEDDNISSTCCNNQNAANDTCDVHPCLDAIDELGIVEILDSSNFLGATKVECLSFWTKTRFNWCYAKVFIHLLFHLKQNGILS